MKKNEHLNTIIMVRIGITGQSGFIGTHLYNYFGLMPDRIKRIPFEDVFFEREGMLRLFVQKGDAIIHLAAINRHEDPDVLYHTNVMLAEKLIAALEETNSSPHVLFASSIQEDRDNTFGRSKKKGRIRFSKWAAKNHSFFTGMILPNVFGPFGRPFYNSVVSTFCYQATHGKSLVIETDALLPLIYIDELSEFIWKLVSERITGEKLYVPATAKRKVSELKTLIERFASFYTRQRIIPGVADEFEKRLFQTFMAFIDLKSFFPVKLKLNSDKRGTFVELQKTLQGGQISFSTTHPGITRGDHFHTRKTERFAVIRGEARIQLRRTGTSRIMDFFLSGEDPGYVDIPVWYTHSITNTGNDDLFTVFWVSDFFRLESPDTWYEPVEFVSGKTMA